MFVAIVVSSLGTQSAVKPLETQVLLHTPPPRNLWVEIRSTLGSRSALTAGAAGMLMMLATGLNYGLGTYLLIYAWKLSPGQISLLSVSTLISAGLGLALSPWVSRRFDKRGATLRVALVLIVLVPLPLALSQVGWLSWIGPNPLLALMIYNLLTTTVLIVVPTLLASMIADVVEENEVRNGRRDEGVVFALNTFVQKCASGLGVFGSTVILAVARFPTRARVEDVPAAVTTHLALIYIAAVMALYVASALCVFFYKITRERHMSNLRILAERRAAVATAD